MVNINLKEIKNIGIVSRYGDRLPPVAVSLFRYHALRSSKQNINHLQFWHAGIERAQKIADDAQGYLQERGFATTSWMQPERVDKYWVKTKDLILVFDRFERKKLIFDFPIGGKDLNSSIMIINEIVGQAPILDPELQEGLDSWGTYDQLEKCIIAILKNWEKL